MKICIEATPIGVRSNDKGGVYRYISNLVETLSCIDHENQYTLFFNFFRKEHHRSLQESIRSLALGNNFSVRLSRFPARFQKFIEPPAEFLAGRFDVFHGCFDHLRPVMFGKGVVTIHDVRYLEDMDDEGNGGWLETVRSSSPSPDDSVRDLQSRDTLFEHLRSTIKKTVRKADMVITVSEFSRRRIIDKLGAQPEKVKVIYHGVGQHFVPQDNKAVIKVLKKFGIDSPFILYTGKFEPLKNLGRLLEAFQKVAASRDMRLVMAGPENWFYYVIREKARQMKIEDKVIFTGFVTDGELTALYSGASVFAFPSLYEGFGLPLLEAMACGAPIVTSNVCSIPEVVGDAAVFADPYSPEDIADKIMGCLENESLSGALVEKGIKQARSFTWRDTAFKTLKVYSGLCQ